MDFDRSFSLCIDQEDDGQDDVRMVVRNTPNQNQKEE